MKTTTKPLYEISRAVLVSVAMLTVLAACTAGDAPLEAIVPEEPLIDAATINPCGDQFDFQRELNGAPDDSFTDSGEVQGKVLVTQQYWYESTSMIVNFSYALDEAWCNVWTESGVAWDR